MDYSILKSHINDIQKVAREGVLLFSLEQVYQTIQESQCGIS